MTQAKDCKCIKCNKQAEVFWPVFDPDIESHPYCRECVDTIKLKLLMKLAMKEEWDGE